MFAAKIEISIMSQFLTAYLLLEKIARLNSRMLACSESEHELGIKVVGYKQERTFVWNNAIPAILFQDVKQPDGILPNERFIISIGRSSYPKNPLLMVETMKRVYEKHSDIHFYLVGVGFYSPQWLNVWEARWVSVQRE